MTNTTQHPRHLLDRSSAPAPAPRRITLRDVAARAGLTPAAASLALRRDRSIPEATRLRVVRAAAELHYVPNAAARALRARSHRTLGVLIFDEGNESQLAFYSEVLLAVADEAIRRLAAPSSCKCPSAPPAATGRPSCWPRRRSTPPSASARRRARCASGSSPRSRRPASPSSSSAGGRSPASPSPTSPPTTPPAPASPSSTSPGSGTAASPSPWTRTTSTAPTSGAVSRGTTTAVEGLGLDAGPDLLVRWEVPLDPGAPPVAANARAVRRAGATAVYAVIFATARRVLVDLHGAGVAVPRDVAVVGFSDNPSAASLTPPLTVVRQPLRALGAAAARLLFEELAGEAPAWPVTLPPALVVRRSCGAVAPGRPSQGGDP